MLEICFSLSPHPASVFDNLLACTQLSRKRQSEIYWWVAYMRLRRITSPSSGLVWDLTSVTQRCEHPSDPPNHLSRTSSRAFCVPGECKGMVLNASSALLSRDLGQPLILLLRIVRGPTRTQSSTCDPYGGVRFRRMQVHDTFTRVAPFSRPTWAT